MRDYGPVIADLRAVPAGASRVQRMQAAADAIWRHLRETGVSWVGFYLHDGGTELTLGPRRDKPACSPIGMHGACGQAFRAGRPLLVRDVADLGASYIACDPRDRSEVVLPLVDAAGVCWGVLDVDSHNVAAFDESDVAGLQRALAAAGLGGDGAAGLGHVAERSSAG